MYYYNINHILYLQEIGDCVLFDVALRSRYCFLKLLSSFFKYLSFPILQTKIGKTGIKKKNNIKVWDIKIMQQDKGKEHQKKFRIFFGYFIISDFMR